MSSSTLPATHTVLKLTSPQQSMAVETVPTPRAGPGSAVIRVLTALILPYSGEVYGGDRSYPLPFPFVPGQMALGRIVETGPDATTLVPDQFIVFDATIRGRDNSNAVYLSGIMQGMTEGSQTLSRMETWRDSTYAQFAKVPLENCLPVNEQRLKKLGYGINELAHLLPMFVPFGGLSDIGLKYGETIAIAPATGMFGGAAVRVALAMGARVIALGRNEATLTRLEALDPKRVAVVKVTGNVENDAETIKEKASGRVDVFFDISPPMANESTHFRSCLAALKFGGRVNLMGGNSGFPLTTGDVTWNSLTIKGTQTCTRDQALQLVKMVESGLIPLEQDTGLKLVGKFGLDQWKTALETAAQHPHAGEVVTFAP